MCMICMYVCTLLFALYVCHTQVYNSVGVLELEVRDGRVCLCSV